MAFFCDEAITRWVKKAVVTVVVVVAVAVAESLPAARKAILCPWPPSRRPPADFQSPERPKCPATATATMNVYGHDHPSSAGRASDFALG